jgi:hypothetical protein
LERSTEDKYLLHLSGIEHGLRGHQARSKITVPPELCHCNVSGNVNTLMKNDESKKKTGGIKC